MDQLITQILATSPMAALLGLMLWTVYQDAKKDREQAAKERQSMIEKLDTLSGTIHDLTNEIVILRRQLAGELVK